MDENKIKELNERTVQLLEVSKKDMKKYSQERKKLYEYFSLDVDEVMMEEWEKELNKLESLLKL